MPNFTVRGLVIHRDLDQMELKVKGKFVTSSKLEKINENYDKNKFFGYHDALKIYGAPKL